MFVLGIMLSTSFVACQDEGTDASADPVIRYFRLPKISAADSMLTSVSLGQTIAIIGENLDNIVDIKFNDQTLVLNSCFITPQSIVCTVPKNLPEEKTEMFYFTAKNGHVIEFPMITKMPNPLIENISKGYLKTGDKIVIDGNYFIETEDQKISVILPGGLEVKPDAVSITQITITVPEGANANGALRVKGFYGVGSYPYEVVAYSKLKNSDVEGLLFDFDGLNGALASGQGWRDGSKWTVTPEFEFTGKALLFDNKGEVAIKKPGEYDWMEDNMMMNYWPSKIDDKEVGLTNMIKEEIVNVSDWAYQFEILVPKANPWKCMALCVMPTSYKTSSMENASNKYYGDGPFTACYLYEPYLETPDFTTNDEWVTVTCPIGKIHTDMNGKEMDGVTVKDLAGLTLMWNKGTATDLVTFQPKMYIDNIRLVKAKY